MKLCAVCHDLLSTADRDNVDGAVGPVCGGCVRAKRRADELTAADPRMAELASRGREALDAARAAFGHLVTCDTTAEAMCGYIEQRLAEHGLAVSVHYTFVEDPLDGAFARAGFVRVTPGDRRELRFSLVPRWVIV